MVVEVGKTYRGLANGCVFSILDEFFVDSIFSDIYLKIKLKSGSEFVYTKSYIEHLLIEEVK